MKSYCTQNSGDCSTCSLVNYGRDCRNNPVNNQIAIAGLVDTFFADLEQDGRPATEDNLRAWLWFTCPAQLRGDVESAIRADSRWEERHGHQ